MVDVIMYFFSGVKIVKICLEVGWKRGWKCETVVFGFGGGLSPLV